MSFYTFFNKSLGKLMQQILSLIRTLFCYDITHFFKSIYSFSRALAEIGYLLNDSTRLALHIILLFSAVIAFNQLRKLDINEHSISLLDDVLLFICLPAFFMETVFSMIATISILNIVKTTDYVVMVRIYFLFLTNPV